MALLGGIKFQNYYIESIDFWAGKEPATIVVATWGDDH